MKLVLLLGVFLFLPFYQCLLVEDYNFTVHTRFSRSVANMDKLLKLEEDLALNLEKYAEVLMLKANTIKWWVFKVNRCTLTYILVSLKGVFNWWLIDTSRKVPWHGITWKAIRLQFICRRTGWGGNYSLQNQWVWVSKGIIIYFSKHKTWFLEYLDYMKSIKPSLPQSWDFNDASEGLRRMQGVYQLKANDISGGLLDGVKYKYVWYEFLKLKFIINSFF